MSADSTHRSEASPLPLPSQPPALHPILSVAYSSCLWHRWTAPRILFPPLFYPQRHIQWMFSSIWLFPFNVAQKCTLYGLQNFSWLIWAVESRTGLCRVDVPRATQPFPHAWVFRLFPIFGSHQQCCSEHPLRKYFCTVGAVVPRTGVVLLRGKHELWLFGPQVKSLCETPTARVPVYYGAKPC